MNRKKRLIFPRILSLLMIVSLISCNEAVSSYAQSETASLSAQSETATEETVINQAPVTQLWVGTTQVIKTEDEVTAILTTSGDGWSYDAETQTLTLDGADITVSDITGAGVDPDETGYHVYAVYCIGDLNLVLKGTNRITASGENFSAAIKSKSGNLSVSGEGSLLARGGRTGILVSNGILDVSDSVQLTGETTKTNTSGNTGVLATEISVSDKAHLTGHASIAQRNDGVYCSSGNVTIGSGATMTGIADTGYTGSNTQSYGLRAGNYNANGGEVSVEGTLIASGGDATDQGYVYGVGLYNSDLVVSGNGSVSAKSGETAGAGASSYGVGVSGDGEIIVQGGGFLASGGNGAVNPAATQINIDGSPVHYEVSTNRDGSSPVVFTSEEDWATVNGNFGAYKYIKATTIYEVYINGTQVTRVNRNDVLGDGTASYTPASGDSLAALILNGAKLNGAVLLDGDTTISLTGENSVESIENTGELFFTGSGEMTVSQKLDCAESEVTIADGASLTLQGDIAAGTLINNGTLLTEGDTEKTIMAVSNTGSFTNTGNMTVTGEFSSTGTIINDGVLILPSGTDEATAKSITGGGLTEVVGSGETPSAYYSNGTKLAAVTQALDFSKEAGNGEGQGFWSLNATLLDNGYQWDAQSKTLILENIFIETGEKYAVIVPAEATVVLQGNNFVNSSGEYGIKCEAALKVQGSGSIKSTDKRLEVLYAEQLTVTGDANVTTFSIYNGDKFETPSVTISENAVLNCMDSIFTGNYTQTDNATVLVEDTDDSGISTINGKILITGGTLTIRGEQMALEALGIGSTGDNITIGSGMMIQTPAGGKVASKEIEENGIAATCTSVIPASETSLSLSFEEDMITSPNAAKEVVITPKQPQEALSIESIGAKTYGDSSFTLSTAGGSGDGAVSFASSDSTVVSISGNTATIHKAGTVTITATKAADNAYLETTASAELTIAKASIAKAAVSGITSKNYTGKAIGQSGLNVKLNGKTLKNGTDYTVSYKNNLKIGTALITITGKGIYTGTVEKNFQIKVSKGTVYTVSSLKYKITDAKTNGAGTVTLTGSTKSKSALKGTLKIGDTVTIDGKSFKITAIGDKAFKGYTKLTKVTVGKNVSTIGKETFSGCSNIKSVTISTGLKTISSKAFYNCKKLKTITISSKQLKTVGKDAVRKIYGKAVVKVPSSKVSAYKKVFKSSTGFTGSMKLKK